MITKSLSKKQVIIPIGSNNSEKVMAKINIHVSNINRLLKRVKSEISIDFIWSDNKKLLITTNKVAIASNLNIIEKYIKDLNNVDSDDIINSRLPQSKLYLKILSIHTNLSLSSDIVERVIKQLIFLMLSYYHCILILLNSLQNIT